MKTKRAYFSFALFLLICTFTLFVYMQYRTIQKEMVCSILGIPALFDSVTKNQFLQAQQLLLEQGYSRGLLFSLLLRSFISPLSLLFLFFLLLLFALALYIPARLEKEYEKNLDKLLLALYENKTDIDSIKLNQICLLFQEHSMEWQRQKENLVLKMHEQQEQIENLIHQIKSDLSAVLLYGQYSLKKQTDSFEMKAILDCCKQACDKATAFLKQSKANEFMYYFQFSSCDLSQIVQECLEKYRWKAQKRQIHMESHLLSCPLFLDAFWIGQAIGALLDNCLEYASLNSTLKISMEEKENTIEMIIEEKTEQPHQNVEVLFQRFTTPKENADHFGIGLHMAKTVFEQHFGKIELLSDDTSSLIFICSFPKHNLEQAKPKDVLQKEEGFAL
jgi:signal transduction histidine kinase